ncbi:hypothetical protein GUJ93_ZPchr0216g11337 [Zizania palustris]|uniref:Uncharacterized protein n=1 Tax=Zizania palustris TaxID=103762 RepID=A0A8J5RAR9_ZIZPA|nr:hypothetical protein GUJ93_ZPchr0465g6492 [Zizania palustris]KAG8043284.1 hypothetical protein GUJ93_ZPchr0216g11337 [Zizania palustris]
MAKKKCRSTVGGTRAGYYALARLQNFAAKFSTALVSLYAGSDGNGRPRNAAAFRGAAAAAYSSTAVAVVLSNVPTVLVYGAIAMAKAKARDDELVAAVRGSLVGWAREAIERVCVEDVGPSSRLQSLPDDGLRVGLEPLTCRPVAGA